MYTGADNEGLCLKQDARQGSAPKVPSNLHTCATANACLHAHTQTCPPMNILNSKVGWSIQVLKFQGIIEIIWQPEGVRLMSNKGQSCGAGFLSFLSLVYPKMGRQECRRKGLGCDGCLGGRFLDPDKTPVDIRQSTNWTGWKDQLSIVGLYRNNSLFALNLGRFFFDSGPWSQIFLMPMGTPGLAFNILTHAHRHGLNNSFPRKPLHIF